MISIFMELDQSAHQLNWQLPKVKKPATSHINTTKQFDGNIEPFQL